MKLYKDDWSDLASDDKNFGEFRQRNWGFYYANKDGFKIKLHRLFYPCFEYSKYYL